MGCCTCTGFMAPVLGGGHGFLQGVHGLPADQLLEARVVLGDGSVVTTSADSYPDLFWAMRGAGQNFGVVTEFTYRLYDVPKDDSWIVQNLVFAADKLEQIFSTANKMTGDGRHSLAPELLVFGGYSYIPSIDPDNACHSAVHAWSSVLTMLGCGCCPTYLPGSRVRFPAV